MDQRKIYTTSQKTCTGCRVCETICSLVHDSSGINPRTSRIRIVNLPEKGLIMPMVCRLCRNAPCVQACPVDALSQDPETGVIHVDSEQCTGCGLCMEACDRNAISLHPITRTVFICDLCGGNPRCVKYCMNRTIVFASPEEYRTARGRKTMDGTLTSFWSEAAG